MSHVKVISPGAQDLGGPSVEEVRLSGRGLIGSDYDRFVKRAAATDLLRDLDSVREKVAADETLVHLLAIGSTERFGCNRNGDGFRAAICSDYHPTFVKHAKFYRNHSNKDPAKSYGRIVKSAWNDKMHRIELLVALNSNEFAARRNGGLVADQELTKLAAGKDIPVSMACVTDPSYPVLTRDRGYVRIADIRVGDFVSTKDSGWRRVHQLNRRRYTGEVFEFSVNGLPFPLELTADHLMWAKVFSGSRKQASVKAKAGRFFRDTEQFNKSPAGWTHAAHLAAGDRFFFRPVDRYQGYGRITDPDLAAIVGYFVSEGSLQFNGDKACTVEFTCNIDDSLPRRLPGLLERMYPDVTVDITPRRNSDVALSVCIYSTKFAEFLRKYVGHGVRNKIIPPEIMNADREVKLAFLGTWLDGDGWVDKKGGHWSTCNENLVLQGRDLLATTGIPSSIYKIDHSKCGTSGYENSGIEYTLNVSHLDLWNLSGFSAKVSDYPSPKLRSKPAVMRLCPDGSYAYRISSVTSRFVSDVVTYNFEVEDDHSYTLAGLISHNCTVPYDVCSYCGNQAPTLRQYCAGAHQGGMCKAGGLRDNIGSLIDIDGGIHQLHADNTRPKFFDISHVFRPADRIAYVTGVLTKAAAAGRVIKSAELAQQMGLSIPYELAVEADQPRQIHLLCKLAYQLADEEASLVPENHVAAAMACSPDLRSEQSPDLPPLFREKFSLALRALADQQICLSLDKFVELVADQPREKAAEIAALTQRELPGIYGRLVASGRLVDRIQESRYTPADVAPPRYVAWATKLAADLSLADVHVRRRASLASIRDANWTWLQPVSVEKSAADRDVVTSLAEEYALYQLSFLGALDQNAADSTLTRRMALIQNHVA